MENRFENQIYCSLDIETTGFDTKKDEIIEVGMVFFSISEEIQIHKTYSKLFKPTKKLKTNIVGLTGITDEMLEDKDFFESAIKETEDLLHNTIIVGHNIKFDISFLQAKGVGIENKSIDTMELVQFILPTHHGYNLENLVSLLSIQGENKHRATDDALCSAMLLIEFIKIFNSFSNTTKHNIITLLDQQKEIVDILNIQLTPKYHTSNKPNQWNTQNIITINNEISILNHNIDLIHHSDSLYTNKKTVVIYTNDLVGFTAWKHSTLFQYFSYFNRFSEYKFNQLLNKENKTKDEAIFCSKILVWKDTNWQKQYIFDLNLNYLGANFRNQISEKKHDFDNNHSTITDLFTFIQLDKNKLNDFVFQIIGFESFYLLLLDYYSKKVSWNNFTTSIKTELNKPNSDEATLMELIEKTDLLFSMIILTIKKYNKDKSQTVFNTKNIPPIAINKINYLAQKIKDTFNNTHPKYTTYFKKITDLLMECLHEDSNHEIILDTTTNLLIKKQPRDISSYCRKLFSEKQTINFISDTDDKAKIDLIKNKLGLSNLNISEKRPHTPTITSIKSLDDIEKEPTPSLIHFESFEDLAGLYKKIQPASSKKIYAEKYTGGITKIINNAKHNPNSILLVTDKLHNAKHLLKIEVQSLYIYINKDILNLINSQKEHTFLKNTLNTRLNKLLQRITTINPNNIYILTTDLSTDDQIKLFQILQNN